MKILIKSFKSESSHKIDAIQKNKNPFFRKKFKRLKVLLRNQNWSTQTRKRMLDYKNSHYRNQIAVIKQQITHKKSQLATKNPASNTDQHARMKSEP